MIEVDFFNFHFLFEKDKNQKISELGKIAKLNINYNENLEKFYNLIRGNKFVTLNKKNSEYDYCN